MPRSAIGSSRQLVKNFGTCLNFAGGSNVQDVSFADSNSLDLTNTFTLMAWINPASLGASNAGRILAKEGGGGQAYDFLMGPNNAIRVFLVNTIYASSNNVIRLGVWQHVAVTFDKDAGGSSEIKFYVNGAAAGVASRSTALTTNGLSLLLGSTSTHIRTFDGKIDEVKIFNTTLTPAQIIDEYYKGQSSGSGLVLYTKFDEGSGTASIDSSGTQANGTITGATYSSDVPIIPRTATSSRVLPQVNTSCLSFPGGNNAHKVTVKSTAILAGATDLSILAWVKPDAGGQPTSGGTIYGERNLSAGNDILDFRLNNTGELKFSYRDDANTLDQPTGTVGSVVNGVWSHVAVVKVGTAITFYVNGTKKGTATLTAGNTLTNVMESMIGNDARSGNATFNGLIDDVQIARVAVTQADIRAVIEKGTTITSCLGRWKLDEGSGTTVIDATGTQANGTIVSATYSTSIASQTNQARSAVV